MCFAPRHHRVEPFAIYFRLHKHDSKANRTPSRIVTVNVFNGLNYSCKSVLNIVLLISILKGELLRPMRTFPPW